jgi:hypothetical protein
VDFSARTPSARDDSGTEMFASELTDTAAQSKVNAARKIRAVGA